MYNVLIAKVEYAAKILSPLFAESPEADPLLDDVAEKVVTTYLADNPGVTQQALLADYYASVDISDAEPTGTTVEEKILDSLYSTIKARIVAVMTAEEEWV